MLPSCSSHPGVLGSIPKREEPGKNGPTLCQSTGFLRAAQLRAVVVLQKCCVHVLEHIKGRGDPGGWIMEVVAWQPNLLGRASKVPRKATNLAFVVYVVACLEIVLLGTPNHVVTAV